MRHIKKYYELLENSDSNKGPFLVMSYDLARGESYPVRVYSNLKESRDYVLAQTLADIETYESFDSWIDEKSEGAVHSLPDFLGFSDSFINDFLYSWEILENPKNPDTGMDSVCTEFEILQEYYTNTLSPEEKRGYEALRRYKGKII